MYKTIILKKQKAASRPFYQRYTYAILATVCCIAVQYMMKPILGPMQYFLLFPLVFIVVALGGFGPALVTILIGGLGASQFLAPPSTMITNVYSPDMLGIYKFVIFAFSTLAGSWFVHLIQNKQSKLEKDIDVLRDSDRQFKIIADSTPVLIWMINANKEKTWVNKGWANFMGMSVEESLRTHHEKYIYPGDVKMVVEGFSECINARKDCKMEYRMKGHDGEYRWMLCNAVPMYVNSEFVGYLGVCVDINDQKVAEEKIKRALQSRDQFLAVASHELKTPISSLTLQAQVFKKMIENNMEISKEKTLTISEQITRQVFRLDRLIDDMLDNSRINSGRFNIHPESLDLSELTEDVIERVKNQFSNNRDGVPVINYTKEFSAMDLYAGTWDKIKLEQVLTNLLTNAIKYGNKKPIEVSIKPGLNSVKISVTDHGQGIEKENLDKIFNRYYRVSGTSSTTSENGLGLGLFISKQIVKAHNGRIWVESDFGKGSTFIIELPKHANEASEDYNA